jgi:hypothetical protein
VTGRAVAALGALVALASLWLAWFEPGGEFLVLFGALDRQTEMLSPNAWQAFGWQDAVLAGFAVATLAVAAVGRRWWVVPLAGAAFAGWVGVADRSREIYNNELGASEAGLVAAVAFAVAAVALAAGRYRARRR